MPHIPTFGIVAFEAACRASGKCTSRQIRIEQFLAAKRDPAKWNSLMADHTSGPCLRRNETVFPNPQSLAARQGRQQSVIIWPSSMMRKNCFDPFAKHYSTSWNISRSSGGWDVDGRSARLHGMKACVGLLSSGKAHSLSSSIKIVPASRGCAAEWLCQATVGWVGATASPAIPHVEWPLSLCLCH